MRSLPTGAHRALWRSCCTVTGRYRLPSTGARRGKEVVRASVRTPAEPMFGYKGKWGVKVYRPMSEVRFVYGGHTGDNYCFGLEQDCSLRETCSCPQSGGGEKDVLNAGGARLPCHLLQLGDLGHPGEDRAQVGLSLQAHRVLVRYGQDGAGGPEKHRAQLSEYGVKRLVLRRRGRRRRRT